MGKDMDKIFIVMEYVEHDLKALMETMQKPFTQGVFGAVCRYWGAVSRYGGYGVLSVGMGCCLQVWGAATVGH